MINRIFYCDNKILSFEVLHRWYEAILYIEETYEKYKFTPYGDEVLCLGLFETWYIINQLPDTAVRYIVLDDYDFYKKKWRYFLGQTIERFYNSPSVCWIAGYTATNNIPEFKLFKNFGADIMRRGRDLSNETLPVDVLSGKKRKTKNDYFYIVPNELFPSGSVADKYFTALLDEYLKDL